MASLFQKSITRYLLNGRQASSTTPGARKVTVKSETWSGKYTGANGELVVESLGTKSHEDALQILAQRAKRAQKEAAGDFDSTEEHRLRPIAEHVADYFASMTSEGATGKHVNITRSRLTKLLTACAVNRLADINPATVQRFLSGLRAGGLGPKTSNYYLVALRAFVNWGVKDGRLNRSPIQHVGKVNETSDIRHPRRPITMEELGRVVEAAESSQRTKRGLSGPDRGMLYALAGTTGLRAQELASLTPESFDLTADPPTVTIQAQFAKNRKEATLPLHGDMVAKLRPWLAERSHAERVQSTGKQTAILSMASVMAKRQDRLWPGLWYDDGAAMLRIDLKAAGIPYVTTAGFCDFHSLRHTFISALANAGVHPRQAQLLARHHSIELTMQTYTHIRLNDLAGAVSSLPTINAKPGDKATGT